MEAAWLAERGSPASYVQECMVFVQQRLLQDICVS